MIRHTKCCDFFIGSLPKIKRKRENGGEIDHFEGIRPPTRSLRGDLASKAFRQLKYYFGLIMSHTASTYL